MRQGKLAEARLDFEECLKLDRSLKPLVEERVEVITRQVLQLKDSNAFLVVVARMRL